MTILTQDQIEIQTKVLYGILWILNKMDFAC